MWFSVVCIIVLSTTICVITVVIICCGCASRVHNIFAHGSCRTTWLTSLNVYLKKQKQMVQRKRGTEEQRNGATEERSNRGTEQRRNGGKEQQGNRGTEERRNGGTEERSNRATVRTEEQKDDLTDVVKCILGFHVTSEGTILENFEFSPSSGKSHV